MITDHNLLINRLMVQNSPIRSQTAKNSRFSRCSRLIHLQLSDIKLNSEGMTEVDRSKTSISSQSIYLPIKNVFIFT